MLRKLVNSIGTILQGHSHMEGISSSIVDREGPEELQTSRGRIIAVLPDDTSDVSANTGAARDKIRAHRTKTLIFLI